ncbi:glycosyltransferase family 2 protein [Leptospira kmetyi]|uniref:Glycosyl transferase n=1 Tax=Leptospira kmetyi TaxID=408139 RepID=A0A5F1XWF7_9LEPT|nr:glycosyltransferase family 2 protein [Leptospira kmetyi]AYV55133.1 glycosyltransferase [Leptospira kmetyi]PJZ30266.1 glycosyl transferase [Leptospira kmetyi]TGK19460.1 glycosyltransferase [Leptospira kmetyi]TGK32838.1 glycosyltransferase [Leptospira kmetyi]
MDSNQKITVLLPAYNEELTIADTILSFFKELPKAEFIVIDNNSKDRTNEIAKATLKKHKIKGKVVSEFKQGKANAVRKGFASSYADCYVMVDADMTYPAEEVHKLIEAREDGDYDMVVGDRLSGGSYKKENKRMFHSFGNNLVIRLINFLFAVKIRDAMSGYRIFSNRFVRHYPILSKGFELEIEMTLHVLDKRLSYLEVPVRYLDRPKGSSSKLNTIRDGYSVVKNILWIFKDYKPMHFFGFIAGAAFLASLCVGFPAILDYIRYRYVYHVPLAILATGLMIGSMINFSIGLILHTVSKIQRFNFELEIIKWKG